MPGGIRNRNPSKRAVADPYLRPRGHWHRLLINQIYDKMICVSPSHPFVQVTKQKQYTNVSVTDLSHQSASCRSYGLQILAKVKDTNQPWNVHNATWRHAVGNCKVRLIRSDTHLQFGQQSTAHVSDRIGSINCLPAREDTYVHTITQTVAFTTTLMTPTFADIEFQKTVVWTVIALKPQIHKQLIVRTVSMSYNPASKQTNLWIQCRIINCIINVMSKRRVVLNDDILWFWIIAFYSRE